MKCRRCKAPALIDVRRHNAAFCADCFVRHCQEQVRRAIDGFDMIQPGERVLMAVSGGKDSLGAWGILVASANKTTGPTPAPGTGGSPAPPGGTPPASPPARAPR